MFSSRFAGESIAPQVRGHRSLEPDRHAVVAAATAPPAVSHEERLSSLGAHAAHQFTAHTAGELTRLDYEIQECQRAVERLDQEAREIADDIKQLEPRLAAKKDAVAWTVTDFIQVIVYLIIVLAMLAASCNVTTTVLLNSGLFTSTFAACTLTVLPLMGAIILECFHKQIRSDRARLIYRRVLGTVALLLWGGFVWLFSSSFGHGFAESTSAVMDAILNGVAPEDMSPEISLWFLVLSYVAEAASAAFVLLCIESILAVHANYVSKVNPEVTERQKLLTAKLTERAPFVKQLGSALARREQLRAMRGQHAGATVHAFEFLSRFPREHILTAAGLAPSSQAAPIDPALVGRAHNTLTNGELQ